MGSRLLSVKHKQVLAAFTAAALVVLALHSGAQAADGFRDVPTGNVHHDSVKAVRNAYVTVGCAGTAYCPGETVRRDQMASFLDRLGALSGQEPVVHAATARQARDSERLGGVGAGDILGRLSALEGVTGEDGTPDTELVERVETLETELAAAVNRIAGLEGQVTDSNGRIEAVEGELTDANARIDTLESRIDALESAVLTLQGEHSLNLLSSH